MTGLTNGVSYTFAIRAVNAVGGGAPSTEQTATPILPITVTPTGPLTLLEDYAAQKVTFTLNYVPSGASYPNLLVNYSGGAGPEDIRYYQGVEEPDVVGSTGGSFPDAGALIVYADGGEVQFAAQVTYWFRARADQDTDLGESFTVRIAFMDSSGEILEVSPAVTINLEEPPNRRPKFDSPSKTYTVNDGAASGSSVGEATAATDADSDTLTYSLTGVDAAHFLLDSTTGVITVGATALDLDSPADNDSDNDYELVLEVADGKDAHGNEETSPLTDDKLDVTVRVTEPPTDFPAKPTELTATAGKDSTINWINLRWTKPSPENNTISRYQYQKKVPDGNFGDWQDIPNSAPRQGNQSGVLLFRLTNGVEHTFKIRAVNNLGVSEASDTATATPVWKPERPVNLVGWPDKDGVILTWDTPPDNGSPITKYQYNRDFSSFEDVPGSGPATTHFVVAGLTDGTEYYFQLRAINNMGDGTLAHVTVTPATPQVPGKPTVLTATAGDREVTLIWEDPINPTITKYQYRQSEDGGETWPVGWMDIPTSAFREINHTSYTLSNLTNGIEYTFSIVPYNSTGAGPWSETVTGTPNRAPSLDEVDYYLVIPEDSLPGTDVEDPITARDLDGDDLTFSLSGAVAESFQIEPQTGQIRVSTGTQLDYETRIEYTGKVRVNDGRGGQDEAKLTIKITNVNEAPEVRNPIQDQNMTAGTGSRSLSLSERFSDPDGDTFTYSASSDDERVVIAQASGPSLTLTPIAAGSAIVTVTATEVATEGESEPLRNYLKT